MNTPQLKSLTMSALLAGLAASTTTLAAANANCRACYDFNEPGGDSIIDTSPGGMWPGVLQNPATRTNTSVCGPGSSLSLNGEGAYATAAPGLLNNLPQGTVEAWIYLESINPISGDEPVVSKGDTTLTQFVLAVSTNTIAVAGDFHRDGFTVPATIPLRTWTKVAVTWNGTVRRLFVNDVMVGEEASDYAPPGQDSNPVQIGRHNHIAGPFYFHGLIEDLQISDVAREFSPPVFFSGNGHYYKVFTNRMSWTQAVVFARSQTYNCRPGHLATITSRAENDFVASLILGHHAWIGGFQDPNGAEPGEGWRWITGERFNYRNWNSGEPNDGLPPGTHDVMQLYGRNSLFYGTWNDLSDTPEAADAFVVEFEPLEASIEVSQVEVCWNSVANRMYQVEYRSDLTANQWTAFSSPVAGTGVIMCITDSTRPGPQKFYRVRELP